MNDAFNQEFRKMASDLIEGREHEEKEPLARALLL